MKLFKEMLVAMCVFTIMSISFAGMAAIDQNNVKKGIKQTINLTPSNQ